MPTKQHDNTSPDDIEPGLLFPEHSAQAFSSSLAPAAAVAASAHPDAAHIAAVSLGRGEISNLFDENVLVCNDEGAQPSGWLLKGVSLGRTPRRGQAQRSRARMREFASARACEVQSPPPFFTLPDGFPGDRDMDSCVF